VFGGSGDEAVEKNESRKVGSGHASGLRMGGVLCPRGTVRVKRIDPLARAVCYTPLISQTVRELQRNASKQKRVRARVVFSGCGRALNFCCASAPVCMVHWVRSFLGA